MVRSICSVAAGAATLLSTLAAQEALFVEGRVTSHLPPGDTATRAMVALDVDSDGAVDLLCGTTSGLRFLRNDGAARFADAPNAIPVVTDEVIALASADVDGDGDPDVVAGFAAVPLALLRNDGGLLVDATAGRMPALAETTGALAFADVDRDGDFDLVVGTISGRDRLLANDGTGTFTDVSDASFPPGPSTTVSIGVADLTGDGAPELLLGYGSLCTLLSNDGTGRFTDVSTTHLPPRYVGAFAWATGDVDRDGFVDVLVGTGYGAAPKLWRNDGTGRLVDVSGTHLPGLPIQPSAAVALADLDGDGDLDALVGFGEGAYPAPARAQLLRNDGAGVFTPAPGSDFLASPNSATAFAIHDFDGDGDRDVAVAHDLVPGGAPDELFLNIGGARFVPAAETAVPIASDLSNAIAVGDVDGDGFPDLVSGRVTSLFRPDAGKDRLLRYDPQRSAWVDVAGALPAASVSTPDVALADLDGDGDLDLVAAHRQARSAILINDGNGTFTDETATRMPTAPVDAETIGVADFDADGDLDVFFGRGLLPPLPDALFFNRGDGTFDEVTSTHLVGMAAAGTPDVAVGDVDADGDVDLVLAVVSFTTGSPGARLLRNDGTGRMVNDPTALASVPGPFARAVALGDADHDGDLDLFVGRNQDDVLVLNDGAGRFASAPVGALPDDVDGTIVAAFGDLDLDGDEELVVSIAGDLRFLERAGPARFVDSTAGFLAARGAPVYGLAIADLDEDGDPDLAIAGENPLLGGRDYVLFNRTRQVTLPWCPVPGGTFAFDVHAGPGRNPWFGLALPYIASLRRRFAVPPFGVVGLAADDMIVLDPIYLPPLHAASRLVVRVPLESALIGERFHVQAAVLTPVDAHLTNVASTVVIAR